MMYKHVFALSLVTTALFACSTEEDDSSFSRELTYKVTEENAQATLNASMESTVDDAEENSVLSTDADLSSGIVARSIQARDYNESQTSNCSDSGSLSATLVGDETDEIEGTFSMRLEADECSEDSFYMDGAVSISMTWSEYGDNNSVVIEYDEYVLTDLGETTRMDGEMAISVTTDGYQMSWDIYMESSDFNNQMIHTYTSTDIQGTFAEESLTAGAWRVDGSEGTYVEFLVDPDGNGIYVTVDGNEVESELIPWIEL